MVIYAEFMRKNLELSQMPKNLADGTADDQVGAGIHRSCIAVDKHKLFAAVSVDKTGCRINSEGSSADNQHIRIGNGRNGSLPDALIERFFIKHNIGLYNAAAAL